MNNDELIAHSQAIQAVIEDPTRTDIQILGPLGWEILLNTANVDAGRLRLAPKRFIQPEEFPAVFWVRSPGIKDFISQGSDLNSWLLVTGFNSEGIAFSGPGYDVEKMKWVDLVDWQWSPDRKEIHRFYELDTPVPAISPNLPRPRRTRIQIPNPPNGWSTEDAKGARWMVPPGRTSPFQYFVQKAVDGSEGHRLGITLQGPEARSLDEYLIIVYNSNRGTLMQIAQTHYDAVMKAVNEAVLDALI